jgi:hypothetical protein
VRKGPLFRFAMGCASVTCAAFGILRLAGLPAEPQNTLPATDTPSASVSPSVVQRPRLFTHSAARRSSEMRPRVEIPITTPRVPTSAPPGVNVASDSATVNNQTSAPAGAARDLLVPQSRMTVSMVCELDDPPLGLVAEALQRCIDNAPQGASVDIPRGYYLLRRQVVVRRPITIRTAGSADGSITCSSGPDGCANLVASPALTDDYGVLSIQSTNDVTLEHIVFDGNHRGRLSTRAVEACRAGRNSIGFVASAFDCTRCAMRDVVATHALCGTGMLWIGAQATIERSDFRDNGDSALRLWADGLTAMYAPDSEIRDNRFFENSDVGLILGYGARSRVERNHFVQRTQSLFAGLMLDNFNSDNLSIRGDFRDADVTNNTIDCRQQRCLFGIQVGPRPWYPTRNIVGGHIWDNQIHGAKVGINVDGGGVRQAPVQIFSNRVTDLPAPSYFANCGTLISTGWMNIAPTSFVDRGDETTPTTSQMADTCQFFSPLRPATD